MSYQAVESVMKYSRAKDSARLVLMVIATHANAETYTANPGYELLAQEANYSERTLIRYLKELEKTGEVVITRGNGRGQLTSFFIALPRVKKGDIIRHPSSNQEQAEMGDKIAPETAEKGDNKLHPFGPERVTEKGDNFSGRVTNPNEKGDKTTGAYKDIEPVGTREPLQAGATAEGEQRLYKALTASPLNAADIGKYSFEDYLNYVQAKDPRKQPAQAAGLARKLKKTGEDDDALAAWKRMTRPSSAATTSTRCPKCNNRGDYFDKATRQPRICDCPAGKHVSALEVGHASA